LLAYYGAPLKPSGAEKKRSAPSADIADTAPDAPFVPERLAA
jgi:hypothetical protein